MRLRSIEQKIFLLILPICLIPPVIFMLLLGYGSRATFAKTIGTELRSRAEYLAGMFDGFLEGRVAQLQPLVQAAPLDPAALAAEAAKAGAAGVVVLKSAQSSQPLIELADTSATYGRWLGEAGYFKPEVQQRLKIPRDGLFQDLELSIPARLEPLPFFMFAAETAARERVFFLFEATRLIDDFRHSLPQHPEAFHVYSSSGFVPYAFEAADPLLSSRIRDAMNASHKETRWFHLENDKGHYLIAPADSKLMKHARTTRSQGQGVIWTILLSYDMEAFQGDLAWFIWLSVVIALALTLLVLALGRLAGRQIAEPLVDLKHQAEEIARGHLDAQADVDTNDEIGELADAFNTMASRLRDNTHVLEDRLADNQLRANHINIINEITGAIIQVLSLESIFEILTRELGKLVRHDAMWIALFDERGAELAIRHIHPAGLITLFDRGRIPLAGSIHGHVVDSHETMHAEIGHRDLPGFFETRIFRTEGFQSYLIAPLPSRNRIIGTLTIAATAPDAFSASLNPIMTSLAGAVAVAIEQTNLFQRISRFASDLEHKVDDRTRELERANKKLIQTEKYFATGRMAGNLAHEINNPLGIIKNYLQLVENGFAAGERTGGAGGVSLEHIRIIHEEVDRIARMIRQMINLHRPEEQVVRPIDVNALIEEILELMDHDLQKQGIQVARELDPALPTPLGSPDLIRQVLINLIRNAQDAMEATGGTLTVRTSVQTQWSDGAEHELLRIRIADTGCGIPPEHLSQVFDPFFTTKPPDKGTGLGLCVSYSIVSMYRGTIDVESQVGVGTAVVVTLPVETGEEELPAMPLMVMDPAPTAD